MIPMKFSPYIVVTIVLLALALPIIASDHYSVLGVSRTASKSQIRSAFQLRAKSWHPDKNPSPEAAEKYRQLSEAYEVLSDPQKRNEYELSLSGISSFFRGSGHPRMSPDIIELTGSNWDWWTSHANYHKTFVVLFCADNHQRCHVAYNELEKLQQTLNGMVKFGRVDVNSEWSLVNSFGIRYVPAVFFASPVTHDLIPYKGPLDHDSIYQYMQNSIQSVFQTIRYINDWEAAMDWNSKQSSNSAENVKVVLYSKEKTIPFKWKYWANKYSERIDWYHIAAQQTSQAIKNLFQSHFGITEPGVAILFPNPRDENNFILLNDPDEPNQASKLTSNDIEEWLKNNESPILSKVDSSSFLKVVKGTRYTILMVISEGDKSSNDKLKKLTSMIEPIQVLWEQRRGSLKKATTIEYHFASSPSHNELQFSWFHSSQKDLLEAFADSSRPPPSGTLFIVDRRSFRYSALPVKIDDLDVSTLVPLIVRHANGDLAMRKFWKIPQVNSPVSFLSLLWNASAMSTTLIGLVIVVLAAATVVYTQTPPNKKTVNKEQQKAQPSSKPSSSQANEASSSSSPSPSSSSSTSQSNSTPHQKSPNGDSPPSSSANFSSNSSSDTSNYHKISLKGWKELNGLTQDLFHRKTFTMIMFPNLNRLNESVQWESEMKTVLHELDTDPITFTWVHPVYQKRYRAFWMEMCKPWMQNEMENPESGSADMGIIGVLYHPKKHRCLVYVERITPSAGSKDNDGSSEAFLPLKSAKFTSWLQQILEGRGGKWKDLTVKIPDLGH